MINAQLSFITEYLVSCTFPHTSNVVSISLSLEDEVSKQFRYDNESKKVSINLNPKLCGFFFILN